MPMPGTAWRPLVCLQGSEQHRACKQASHALLDIVTRPWRHAMQCVSPWSLLVQGHPLLEIFHVQLFMLCACRHGTRRSKSPAGQRGDNMRWHTASPSGLNILQMMQSPQGAPGPLHESPALSDKVHPPQPASQLTQHTVPAAALPEPSSDGLAAVARCQVPAKAAAAAEPPVGTAAMAASLLHTLGSGCTGIVASKGSSMLTCRIW